MGTVNLSLSDPATCASPNGPLRHIYVTVTDVECIVLRHPESRHPPALPDRHLFRAVAGRGSYLAKKSDWRHWGFK
jgi:hypothetical protein